MQALLAALLRFDLLPPGFGNRELGQTVAPRLRGMSLDDYNAGHMPTICAGCGGPKARGKRTDNDRPVHSFCTLLTDLGTLTPNTFRSPAATPPSRCRHSQTPLQPRCFKLAGVTPKM